MRRRNPGEPMARDELHAGLLATLPNLFDDALDRIKLALAAAEQRGTVDDGPPPTRDDASKIRTAAKDIRRRLEGAVMRFGVKRTRPGWRHSITAEL